MSCKVEIVTQGSSTTGIGHIRRSLTLVQYFDISGVNARIRPADLATLKVLTSWLDFSSKMLVDAVNGSSQLTLVDVPKGGEYWIKMARCANCPVIALDYFGDEIPDLTISCFEHFHPIPKGMRISGLEYVVIRNEIQQIKSTVPSHGILVLFGGADTKCLGPQIAKRLSEYFDQKVTLVLGPLAPSVDSTDSFEIIRTPFDLPQRMAACEWAVSNGGTSMLELMYLGKPVFVVPQTDAELRFSELIKKRAGILGAGDIYPEMINIERLSTVASRARELIDGRGSERLLHEVKKFL